MGLMGGMGNIPIKHTLSGMFIKEKEIFGPTTKGR